MNRLVWILCILLLSCVRNTDIQFQQASLIKKLESASPQQQAAIVDSIADNVRQITNPQEYTHLLLSIKKLNEKTESPELQISQIYLEAELERIQGNSQQALKLLYQALPLFNNSKRESTKIKILNLIGYLFQQRGNIGVTFEKYIATLPTEELNQLGLYTRLLATHFSARNSYDKAMEYIDKQLMIYKTLGDTQSIIDAKIALGDLFFELKNYNSAIKTYADALLWQKNNGKNKNDLFLKIGKTYVGNKDLANARYFLSLAKKVAEKETTWPTLPEIFYWLGMVEYESGNYEPAIQYYTQSIQLLDNNLKSSIVREATLGLAKSLYLKGDKKTAVEWLESLLSEPIEDFSIAAKVAYELASVYSALGKHTKANQYLQQYIKLNDSALQLEKLRLLAQMETQYDLTLKEQRISLLYKESEIKNMLYQKKSENNRLLTIGLILLSFLLATSLWLFISGIRKNRLLRLQNLEIQEKNEELNQMNDELNTINQQLIESENRLTQEIAAQDKLLSIIAHDMKSPLAALKNILNVYQISKDKITPQMLESVINRMNSELDNIFELLNNLLNWAINHRGSTNVNLKPIDVSLLVEETCGLFQEQLRLKHIKLTKAIHPGITVNADINMLQFIIRNFLSNAIKFTPDTCEIIVSVKKENGNVAIRVKDFGVGLSHQELENLRTFSNITPTVGTKGEKGAGIGLILCHEFAQKMNARIEIESSLNVGSTFSLILPLQQ